MSKQLNITSDAKKRGKIYSYTIVHVGFGHMADKVPYVLVLVELENKEFELGIMKYISDDSYSIGIAVESTTDEAFDTKSNFIIS